MSASSELMTRRQTAVARGVANITSVFANYADNAELWDVDGKRYIDFAVGIAVNNTGHNHPKVRAAVEAQLQRFSHTCFHVAPYEGYVALAEKLNKLAPGKSAKKTMLATTGAEAVENAIKIARAHTGRPGVVAFRGGFHGRTLMGMSLTGKVTPYKAGFGPFPGEIYHAAFPNNYHGVTEQDAVHDLNELFKSDIDPQRVAAVIIEPVQGEGGFNIAPPSFLKALRAVCDQFGILLIADEIQTGFARTGRLFAIEHSGIEADLITMAKGIAGGFPISAVTGKADVMDAAEPGGLGGTYAGSPIGCAAALAVLEVIENEGLCKRADEIGHRFKKRLKSLQEDRPDLVGNIRALGSMVAVELVKDGDPNQPAADITKAIVAHAQKHGLIILPCGTRGNVIRFLPPLTISDSLIEKGLSIFETCIFELEA